MKEMDIRELLNTTDHFAASAGCKIVEVDEQHAVAEMTVTSQHLNGGHVCQGGALFTLADLAIAALMNQHGELTFGISNNVMFVASAKEGGGLLHGTRYLGHPFLVALLEERRTFLEL